MVDERSDAILRSLHEANIEFILVGGTAAVLLGAPVTTEDVDIVHRQTPENLDRLLSWLLTHSAYHARAGYSAQIPARSSSIASNGSPRLLSLPAALATRCQPPPSRRKISSSCGPGSRNHRCPTPARA